MKYEEVAVLDLYEFFPPPKIICLFVKRINGPFNTAPNLYEFSSKSQINRAGAYLIRVE